MTIAESRSIPHVLSTTRCQRKIHPKMSEGRYSEDLPRVVLGFEVLNSLTGYIDLSCTCTVPRRRRYPSPYAFFLLPNVLIHGLPRFEPRQLAVWQAGYLANWAAEDGVHSAPGTTRPHCSKRRRLERVLPLLKRHDGCFWSSRRLVLRGLCRCLSGPALWPTVPRLPCAQDDAQAADSDIE